jgi:hypothetical protein
MGTPSQILASCEPSGNCAKTSQINDFSAQPYGPSKERRETNDLKSDS